MKEEKQIIEEAKEFTRFYRRFLHRLPKKDTERYNPVIDMALKDPLSLTMTSLRDYKLCEKKLSTLRKNKKNNPKLWMIHAIKNDPIMREEENLLNRMASAIYVIKESRRDMETAILQVGLKQKKRDKGYFW